MTHLFYIALGVWAAGCQLHASNNDGGAINLATAGGSVFVARGCEGIDVVDAQTGAVASTVAPGGDSDSYDDVGVADGILFALDADDGYLTTFVIEADGNLRQQASDEEVEVGPYSGVSAARSFVAVSGGTSEMTIFSYGEDGTLARLGVLEGHRGHPDVALDPRGGRAIVSTHFDGEVDGHEFGLVSASLEPLGFVDEVGLAGAGFSEGGGTPASWPVRVAFSADHALAAHGGGLSVVRGDADLGLEVVTSLDLGLEAVDVAVDGDLAYAVGASPSPKVVEIDLADPGAPRLGRTFDVGGDDAAPTAIAIVGSTLFVAAGEAGLQLIPR
jgi:hypothetical protein